MLAQSRSGVDKCDFCFARIIASLVWNVAQSESLQLAALKLFRSAQGSARRIMCESRDTAGRLKLQDYSGIMRFFVQEHWSFVTSMHLYSREGLHSIVTLAVSLGLVFPSETTLAVLFVLVHFSCQDWRVSGSVLHTMFLKFKAAYRIVASRLRQSVATGPWMACLPASASDLATEVVQRLYTKELPRSEAEFPVGLDKIWDLVTRGPLRKTNREAGGSMNRGAPVQNAAESLLQMLQMLAPNAACMGSRAGLPNLEIFDRSQAEATRARTLLPALCD